MIQPPEIVFQMSFMNFPEVNVPAISKSPCTPSPCGPNTYCREHGDSYTCQCVQDHRGDPYVGCNPECLTNSDCPKSLACLRYKCQNPCDGTCGIDALCTVSNHIPVCSCPYPLVGDAFSVCRRVICKFSHDWFYFSNKLV